MSAVEVKYRVYKEGQKHARWRHGRLISSISIESLSIISDLYLEMPFNRDTTYLDDIFFVAQSKIFIFCPQLDNLNIVQMRSLRWWKYRSSMK